MSTIKANTLTVKCGSTLTLGESGKTIAIASGASTSGMGRAGAVDWQTSSIKTATFTAVSGEGYFCNTSGGAFTVNLPAGSAGAIVAVNDYSRSFATNNLTVSPNGSEKIGGVTASAVLNKDSQSATFVYVDSTKGWQNVQNLDDGVQGYAFLTATGGTVATTPCGNFKTHTFTSPGNFVVSAVAQVSANNAAAYLVVGGGGGGGGSVPGFYSGGGGGAGGFREFQTAPVVPYTASPLVSGTGITLSAQTYPIVIGAGGAGGTGGGSSPDRTSGAVGSNSSGLGYTSAGGGLGGRSGQPGNANASKGGNGGSGGGTGGYVGPSCAPGGSGNTPPTSPPQGQNGGSGDTPSSGRAGGGGGAGGAGVGAPHPAYGAAGGAGTPSQITGGNVTYSAGGKAGSQPGTNSPAGTNTGNGGSGQENCSSNGVAGASGIVIIRYKIA
tara:strand:+ start:355 stop:1674 length:1320 start_codon:yes stop_codon:yes gene_type:complete